MLSLGGVLGDCAMALGRAGRVTEWLAGLGAGPVCLLGVWTGAAAPGDAGAGSGPVPLGPGGWVFAAGLVIYPLTSGAQTVAVGMALRGEPVELRAALRDALRRYPTLLGLGLLAMAAVTLVGLGGRALDGIAGGPAAGAALGLAVAMLWALTWGVLSAQAVLLEGAPGVLAAVRRSVQLVRGRFARVLGLLLALGLLTVAVRGLLLWAAGLAGAPPDGWVRAVLEQVAAALQWALTAAWATVVYYRVRAEETVGR